MVVVETKARRRNKMLVLSISIFVWVVLNVPGKAKWPSQKTLCSNQSSENKGSNFLSLFIWHCVLTALREPLIR